MAITGIVFLVTRLDSPLDAVACQSPIRPDGRGRAAETGRFPQLPSSGETAEDRGERPFGDALQHLADEAPAQQSTRVLAEGWASH